MDKFTIVFFLIVFVLIGVLIIFLWNLWKDEDIQSDGLIDKDIYENKSESRKMVDTTYFEKGMAGLDIKQSDFQKIKGELSKHIVGMDNFLNTVLTNLLVSGHLLVEGVPGLAKTKTVETISQILDMDFSRIQFTPDMIPSDITGVQIYNSKKNEFETRKGPVFTNIMLGDEINRTTPKVQSALLESMEEGKVSIGKQDYKLPEPFFVLATQNPLEQEGTYPLPEAQLDRFMFKVVVDYPSIQEEKDILEVLEQEKNNDKSIKNIFSVDKLLDLQDKVQDVTISDEIRDYITRLVDRTRNDNDKIEYGVSPRGSISLFFGSRAVAFLEGRDHVVYKDVQRIALSVLRHRLIVSYQAKVDGYDADEILLDLFSKVKLK